MLGKIVKLSQEKQAALIAGDDGKPYVFRFKDWCEDIEISIDLRVEFDVLNEKQAHNVFLAEERKLPEMAKQSGKIVKISHEKQLALILSDDGRQYVFAMRDWCEQIAPEINMVVYFVPVNEKQAHQVSLKDEFDLFATQETEQKQKQQQQFVNSEKTAFRQPENAKQPETPKKTNYHDSMIDKKTGRPIKRLEEPTMMEYIEQNFLNFDKNFEGRASVREYWACILFNTVFIIVTGIIAVIFARFFSVGAGITVFIIPNLYVQLVMLMVVTRRLHDMEQSFWSFFWLHVGVGIGTMIPIVNVILAIAYFGTYIFLFGFNGYQIENKYGLSPIYGYADEDEEE